MKKDIMVGSWLNSASPIIAEIMSHSGFDFVTIDVEHSAIDLPQVQQLFQAMKSGNPNCLPFVRLAGNNYAQTKRFLDAGAEGIIAPMINTAEEAAELVRSAKYPPQGERGVGYCRANAYGQFVEEEVRAANDRTMVVVQIEHVRAIENIEAILSVPGIDAAMIGPYDLSASMGLTAQFDRPEYRDAIDRVLKACSRKGIMPGIHVVQPRPEEVAQRIREGYRFIAYSLDITMLMNACRTGLADIRNYQNGVRQS